MSEQTSHPLSALKLIEPATALAIVTAILYFWGYAYLVGFCEALGFNFYGTLVPFHDYLLSGWKTLFDGLLLLAIALCLTEVVETLGKGMAHLIRKFSKKEDLDLSIEEAPLQGPKYRSGLILVVLLLLIGIGAQHRLDAGRKAALSQIYQKRTVVIYTEENQPLEGKFIYIRDFGSALILGELSEKDEVTRIRILKAGSYAAYSFTKAPLPSRDS